MSFMVDVKHIFRGKKREVFLIHCKLMDKISFTYLVFATIIYDLY